MTMTEVRAAYPKLSFSGMAAEDMAICLKGDNPETLESLLEALASLNNMDAYILTDIPRDGINFNWQAMGMYGGLILKGGKYDLHS